MTLSLPNQPIKSGLTFLAVSTVYCGFARYLKISDCSWKMQAKAFSLAALGQTAISSFIDEDSAINGIAPFLLSGLAVKYCSFNRPITSAVCIGFFHMFFSTKKHPDEETIAEEISEKEKVEKQPIDDKILEGDKKKNIESAKKNESPLKNLEKQSKKYSNEPFSFSNYKEEIDLCKSIVKNGRPQKPRCRLCPSSRIYIGPSYHPSPGICIHQRIAAWIQYEKDLRDYEYACVTLRSFSPSMLPYFCFSHEPKKISILEMISKR